MFDTFDWKRFIKVWITIVTSIVIVASSLIAIAMALKFYPYITFITGLVVVITCFAYLITEDKTLWRK
jgi:hypothetical protein